MDKITYYQIYIACIFLYPLTPLILFHTSKLFFKIHIVVVLASYCYVVTMHRDMIERYGLFEWRMFMVSLVLTIFFTVLPIVMFKNTKKPQ